MIELVSYEDNENVFSRLRGQSRKNKKGKIAPNFHWTSTGTEIDRDRETELYQFKTESCSRDSGLKLVHR